MVSYCKIANEHDCCAESAYITRAPPGAAIVARMSNAARHLMQVLQSMSSNQAESVVATRRRVLGVSENVGMNDVEFWHAQRTLLADVERFEAQLEAAEAAGRGTGKYRQHVAAYYRAVWAPEANWRGDGSTANDAVSPELLDRLDLIADVLDGVQVTLLEDQISDVLLRLGELRQIVEGIETDDLARHHLLWQLDQAIEFASQVDRFGEAAASTRVTNVIIDATEYAESADVDEPTRVKIRTGCREVAIAAFGQVVGTGALALGPKVMAAIGLG